jgi:hypothetical protein
VRTRGPRTLTGALSRRQAELRSKRAGSEPAKSPPQAQSSSDSAQRMLDVAKAQAYSSHAGCQDYAKNPPYLCAPKRPMAGGHSGNEVRGSGQGGSAPLALITRAPARPPEQAA